MAAETAAARRREARSERWTDDEKTMAVIDLGIVGVVIWALLAKRPCPPCPK